MTRATAVASYLLLCSSVSSFIALQHPRGLKNVVLTRLDSNSKELHLLTFDLDDTIFPIDPVIQDANSIMIQTLRELGYTAADNHEIIAASKRIRKEVRERGEEITYSDLRKRSIRCEMERLDISRGIKVDEAAIDKVFASWLNERHASADRNIFPHATNSLMSIRELYPSIVIGAITNGRGNPLYMPSIAQYFEFCISGEDETVFPMRKPDKGIYMAALSKFNEFRSMNEMNWIHVGDDLANDVGASAACGAKTIWLTTNESKSGENGVGFWSTATPEERFKRQEMDRLAKQYVDAEINALDELVGAIENILQKKR